MKYLAAAVLLPAFALTGCAISSGHPSGPNGRPVHWIDGMSMSTTFEKANRLCPHGYTILGDPKYTSPLDYVMTIECKARSAPMVAKAEYTAPAAPVAADPALSKQQLLNELANTPGLSYEEYQRRYRAIQEM